MELTKVRRMKAQWHLTTIALICSGCGGTGGREEHPPAFPERHYETDLPHPEAFQRYLSDFHRDPRDEKARLQVIDLSGQLDPRPSRPPEAEVLATKAVATIKHARSPGDFADAAAAFEQALNVAPWIGSFYNNAAVAYEKAGRPDLAIRHYSWYLYAAPADPEAPNIRAHLGELQYEADKLAKFQAQLASLEGSQWIWHQQVEVVRGGMLIDHQGNTLGAIPPSFEIDVAPEILRWIYAGGLASLKMKFSADFRSITRTMVLKGDLPNVVDTFWRR
jgi:tetratricopeptide (TPR) repeat protein